MLKGAPVTPALDTVPRERAFRLRLEDEHGRGVDAVARLTTLRGQWYAGLESNDVASVPRMRLAGDTWHRVLRHVYARIAADEWTVVECGEVFAP